MNVKKIAIFVEGQTELVFLRHILSNCFNLEKISFECLDLEGNEIPYPYTNEHAIIHFQIINIGNDEKVLAEIKRRESDLFLKGFEAIIGLRDMYSEQYDKKSKGKINKDITDKFIENANEEINKMSKPDKIYYHFAIMEIEAWLLAMYENFERIDDSLTLEFLNDLLKSKLELIDCEEEFYKPSREMYAIFKSINSNYSKSKSVSEKIVANLSIGDFESLIKRQVCQSFQKFYNTITKYNPQ